MAPTSAIVLYIVIWFLVLLTVLPFHRRTQDDDGEIVPGTHAGAPTNFEPRRTFVIVTLIATVLWAVIAGVIISGVISVRDIDWFNRMATPDLGN